MGAPMRPIQAMRSLAGLSPSPPVWRFGSAIGGHATRERQRAAIASRRAPTEDEEVLSLTAPARYLRLGNMMLRRNRPKAAAIEYEKGARLARKNGHGAANWLFDVKLGRTYLALGKPEDALRSVEDLRALQPELPWPHLIAGQALLETGQAKAAVLAGKSRSMAGSWGASSVATNSLQVMGSSLCFISS